LKKLLVLTLSAIFVLGIAATAMAADLDVSGKARMRGTISDAATTATDPVANYDAKIEMKANVKTDAATLKMRFQVLEGDWGGGLPLTGMITDHAYLYVPIGTLHLNVGRQPVNFGTKFTTWDATKDRIKIHTMLNDAKVGLWIDKNTETYGEIAADDKDAFGVFAVVPMGDLKAMGRLWFQQDTTPATGDTSAVVVNPALIGKVGDLSLASEVTIMSGDEFDDAAGDSHTKIGALVAVGIPMDPVTVNVAAAYAGDGYKASKYFTPLVFFGTDQATAVAEFTSIGNENTIAGIVGVDFAVDDATSASAKAAYVTFGEDAAGDTINAVEVDLGLTYAVAENVDYKIALGYFAPNETLVFDEAAVAVSHSLEMSF
jgi:hypothetical protein